MGNVNKNFSLLLILILAASSLIMAKPAFAQTPTPVPTSTPSVPEFTVELVGPPYTVPTTYSLNQSSGQVVANIGYSNEYSDVVVTVKNQPFDATYGSLYYNIRAEEHNETGSWFYPLEPIFQMDQTYPTQSTDSDYTNISLNIQTFGHGTQYDIQVEAMLGNVEDINPTVIGGDYVFEGSTSVWSNAQTISVPANIPLSPTPAPSTSTPTLSPTSTSISSIPNSSLLLITTAAVVVIVFLLAIIIFLLLYMRKRRIVFSQTKTPSNP